MRTRVNLKRRLVITHGQDLLEIGGNEFGNRAGLFVLIDMAEFVRKQADGITEAPSDEYGVAKRKADRKRTKQSQGRRKPLQDWVIWNWKLQDIKDADALGIFDSDTPRDSKQGLRQRAAVSGGKFGLSFGPHDCIWSQLA